MEINRLHNTNIDRNACSFKLKEKKERISNLKKYSQNSNEIIGNYNISFHGLFQKKNNLPQLDARKIDFDCKLEPNIEYYINPNDIIYAGNLRIDLGSDEMQGYISNIKNGKGLVFGREATLLQGMTQEQSREHFRLSKTKAGDLLLTDLGSTNGTRIEQNLIVPIMPYPNFYLEANKAYLLPFNSSFIMGNSTINLSNIKSDIEKLKTGEKKYIGRGANNSYQVNDESISQRHLEIEKAENGVIVKDLQSRNGTLFNGLYDAPIIPTAIDCREITDIVTMQQDKKTYIPKDCQLYLGTNFTLDLRNPNIRNLLKEKKHILVGRNPNCDIVVPEFYTQVSRGHIELETDGDNIIARDLNSTNNTQIIPSSKVKAFYNGADKIELSQSNIGDCFLLSSIYALSRSENGKKLLERMVQVDSAGNYFVTFNNSAPIKILPEELDGERYKDKQKLSVNGDLGVKAIERAYAKRLNRFRNNGKTMFLGIDDGGFISNAMNILSGSKTQSHYLPLNNIDNLLNGIYYNWTPDTAITCTTPTSKNANGYVDPEQRFIGSHAYVVNNIDITNRTVEIKNPHNTKYSYYINFDEFKKYFDYIYTTKI